MADITIIIIIIIICDADVMVHPVNVVSNDIKLCMNLFRLITTVKAHVLP